MATIEQVKLSVRRTRVPASEGTLRAGIVSGLIAGLVMALVMMGHSSSAGMGFWTPMKSIAATWMGVNALVGGFWTVVLGLASHFVCAAFWGAIFSSLIWRREAVAAAFWEGLVYGVAVWLIMTYIGLPIFDQTMMPRVGMMPGWWFYDHLIYGACLCVTPAVRRSMYPAEEGFYERSRERESTAV